jgi:hypothetical protein
MFCLFVLGEPWRIIFRKFAGPFKSLDFLQILLVNVYLGGFFLYIIAIIPLHLFTAITLYTITILSGIVVLLFHRRKFRSAIQNLSLHPKFSFQNRHSFEIITVASMFLFSLFIQTSPLNYLLFGSTRDTSLHSLFVQVLIENKQVPETLQPYLNEGIIYPQGFTPIAAYSVLILNYSPPQAIFYLTPLFNALTILGAYFLGKTLSRKSNLGLSLAFVFAFVALWPKYITWGSNALVVSFPFYFVCLSLLPFLAKDKINIKTIFAIGILFGYLSVLHLQLYETLIVSLFILWLYVALKGEKDRWRKLLNLMAVSGLSLLVLSPFIYRFFAFYQYPGHNIGLPADVEIPISQPSLSLFLTGGAWLFEHLAANTLPRIASLVLFFASVLIIVRVRRKNSFTQTNQLIMIGTATLLGQLLIILFGAIDPANLPFYPNLGLLYIPFYFFIAAFNFLSYHFFSSHLSKKILAKTNEPKLKTKKFLATTISLMLLLGVYAPFLYQSIALDVRNLHGSYAVFSVTTEQDFQLLLWIRDNLPRNAVILVNTYQSGTFIPSIANRKTVFPFLASSYSVSYQKLVALLESNILNATTLNLMKHFNITNIYVGSGVSSWDCWKHQWNPKLFLGNPNFKYTKNFGNAYLFQYNYTHPDTVFFDDFEHALWNENGWQTYYGGNGIGNMMITTNFGYNGSRCLTITAQAVYTPSEREFRCQVFREIFVQNNSNITLSFYLNATEGFHNKLPFNDTFAVFISNVYRNQSLVFTTPNGVYKDYADTILLEDGSEGSFCFDLSSRWREKFNSSFSNPFILEFVNYDFDGVENVAYVDNITVTSTPTA